MNTIGRILEMVRLCIRKRNPVKIDDALRLEPVSRQFGMERGLPIDRYYIEKYLSEQSPLMTGDCLEVASDGYLRKFGKSVKSFGVLHVDPRARGVTVVGDLARPKSLPTQQYDAFVCTQTLNFIFDVQSAVEGMYQILRPGGSLLLTVAAITQVSRHDQERWGDFWRFTPLALAKLLRDRFGSEPSLRVFGNLVAAKALLDGLSVHDLPDLTVLDRPDPDYPVVIGACVRR